MTNEIYKEFYNVIEANPELKEALNNPRLLTLEVKSGKNKGLYIGPEARAMKREIGRNERFRMSAVDMDEYWARELIGLYM
jgi:hypothetical protein